MRVYIIFFFYSFGSKKRGNKGDKRPRSPAAGPASNGFFVPFFRLISLKLRREKRGQIRGQKKRKQGIIIKRIKSIGTERRFNRTVLYL